MHTFNVHVRLLHRHKLNHIQQLAYINNSSYRQARRLLRIDVSCQRTRRGISLGWFSSDRDRRQWARPMYPHLNYLFVIVEELKYAHCYIIHYDTHRPT
jgi:hypothetical protein